MTDEFSEFEQRNLEKYVQATYAYWGALLTINGLLLTFFSLDALSQNEPSSILVYLLIASCTLSMWLIILNFRAIKKTYFQIGKTIRDDEMPDVPEEERKNAHSKKEMMALIDKYSAKWRLEQMTQVNKRNKNMWFRERVTERLLMLETLLIVLILVANQLHSNCFLNY